MSIHTFGDSHSSNIISGWKHCDNIKAGCVPIYWAVDLPEKNLLNPNCYQFINIENSNLADKQLNDAINNYEKYINSKIFLSDAKKVIDNYYAFLCLPQSIRRKY